MSVVARRERIVITPVTVGHIESRPQQSDDVVVVSIACRHHELQVFVSRARRAAHCSSRRSSARRALDAYSPIPARADGRCAVHPRSSQHHPNRWLRAPFVATEPRSRPPMSKGIEQDGQLLADCANTEPDPVQSDRNGESIESNAARLVIQSRTPRARSRTC